MKVEELELTPEQITERANATSGTFDDDGKVIVEKAAAEDGGDAGDAFKPSPVWNYYKGTLSEEEQTAFKLPENLSAENEKELLENSFKTKYTPSDVDLDGMVKVESLHPLAKEIQERSKDESFDASNWLKSKTSTIDLVNSTDDEIIRERYIKTLGIKSEENPNGVTEEEITNGISQLNPLDKKEKANAYRSEMKVEIEKQSSYAPDPAAKQQGIDKHNGEVSQFVDTFFIDESKREKPKEARTIAGIDIGEANFQAYKDKYSDGMKASDDGIKLVQTILGDHKMLAKVGMFLEYEEQIAQHISRNRQKGKEDVMNSLNLTPGDKSGSFGDSKMSDEEKIQRANAPEGSFDE